MKDKLKRLMKKGGGLGFAVVIMIFGVMLLTLPTGGGRDAPEPSAAPPDDAFSLRETEARIAAALAQIDGAGRVTVVLTLKSGGASELATDKSYTEKSTNGTPSDREQREDTVIVGAGGSVQNPVVVRQGYPEYQGALVVADGAGDAGVKLELTRAVAALTGLGTDRITVTRMRGV
ncbi:MAG: stage III sporulation protein AG [Oscillospiraceae bacterium]|jgi:stage III sporulation protein AG|nr:stage III sporulation protein AG [Oscillospiraceae bacterium]